MLLECIEVDNTSTRYNEQEEGKESIQSHYEQMRAPTGNCAW